MASAAASSVPPLRVTETALGTHVVDIIGFSKLRKRHCDGDGFVLSEAFAVGGLEWIVLYQPDGAGDEQGYVGAFVELVTPGAAAWAKVSFSLANWTTGREDCFFREADPTLFAAGKDGASWGTGKLAARWRQLRRSCYVRGDLLRIECAVDLCHGRLDFPDPPAPKLAPAPLDAAALLGSPEGADVAVHAGAAPPFAAHSAVLDAYAPRFLKKHGLGRRRRPKSSSSSSSSSAMRVTVDDMPAQAVEALLHYIYTGALPVVDGLSWDGYGDMLRQLLLAGKRYGLRRLAAICERALCRCVDVESAAATLAVAHRHGFGKLKEVCMEFVSDPENYGAVRESEGFGKLCSWDTYEVARDVWAKYHERRGVPYNELQELYLR